MAHLTAADVRRDALSGRSLLTSLGFLLLLAAFTATGALTFLFSTTFFGPLYLAGFDFYHQVSIDPDSVEQWLRELVRSWPSRRGEALPAPNYTLNYAILVVLLLFVGSRDFGRRKNRTSLLADPVAEPVIRQLLASFGYFRDIVMVRDGDQSMTCSHRVLEVPPSTVIRVRQGRSSTGEQRNLRFVMAHEYAHAVMLDNLANSLLRLLFFWTAGVAAAYVTPLVFVTALLALPTALGIAMLPLAVMLLAVMVGAMLLSMYSVVISYVKTREYFADRAGFKLLAEGDEFYLQDGAAGPLAAAGSWSRDITAYERRWHRQGSSVAARNLLPGALVFWLVQHVLFMIVAPADGWPLVLAYDAVVLTGLLLLWLGLPPHPEGGRQTSLLPVLLAGLAALSLWLSTAGLNGYLMLDFGVQLASVEFGLLLSWPPLIAIVVFTVGTIRLLLRRRPADRRARRSVRGQTWRRVGGLALAAPATLLRLALLVLWLLLAAGALEGLGRALLSADWSWSDVALTVALSAVFLGLTALYYGNLLKPTRLTVALDLIIGGLMLFAFVTCLVLSVLAIDAMLPGQTADARGVMAAISQLAPEQFTPALVGGTICGLVYVGFGLLQFWTRPRRPARITDGV